MKNNQGKTPQQNKDSRNFTFIGIFGLVIMITTCLLLAGYHTGFNKEVEQGLQNDTRPLSPLVNYMVPSFCDTLTTPDSLGSPCIDDADGDGIADVVIDTNFSYDDIDMDCGDNDEYRMWIGDNGDTIWE